LIDAAGPMLDEVLDQAFDLCPDGTRIEIRPHREISLVPSWRRDLVIFDAQCRGRDLRTHARHLQAMGGCGALVAIGDKLFFHQDILVMEIPRHQVAQHLHRCLFNFRLEHGRLA
jgi:hypothetical protein